jgi:ribokinase
MIDVLVLGGIFREVLDGDTSPRRRLGGSGLVAAITSARLGANTALASFIGDEDASIGIAMLLSAKVDASRVIVLPGASGTFVFPTANSRPWPMYRPAEATPVAMPSIPPARTYVVFGMPDFDVIENGWLSKLPREATLLWDRQGWLSRARDHAAASRLAPDQKLYLANEEEAIADFGAAGPDALMSLLPPLGFASAVIKRGRDGCVVVEKTSEGKLVSRVKGFPVETVDTIGSGDAFAGGLAAGIAAGSHLSAAAATANAVASAFLRFKGDPLAPGLAESTKALVDGRA